MRLIGKKISYLSVYSKICKQINFVNHEIIKYKSDNAYHKAYKKSLSEQKYQLTLIKEFLEKRL